ncbi:hypothetical protein ACFXTO_005194 [Malus domestica]
MHDLLFASYLLQRILRHYHCDFDALVSTGLAALGYKYVNLDDCWAERNRDKRGNLRAKSSNFPSGIKALADYVHARGLKLGVYSDAGYYTCSKTMPGSLGHEEQDARTFAEWKVGNFLVLSNKALIKKYVLKGDKRILRNGLVSTATLRELQETLRTTGNVSRRMQIKTTFGGDMQDLGSGMVIFYVVALTALFSYLLGNGGMSFEEYRPHFSIWAVMKDPVEVQAGKLRSKDGLEVWAGPL